MTFKDTVKKVAKGINRAKPYFDIVGFPLAIVGASNAAMLYGLFKVSEIDLSDPSKILLGAGLGVVDLILNKYIVFPLAKETGKISLRKVREKSPARPLNWLITAALVGIGITTAPYITKNVKHMAYEVVRPYAEKLSLKGIEVSKVKLAEKKSLLGRIQRTERWSFLTDKLEKENGMPEGILKYMIMEESFGDPLQINEQDGGAGLIHTQPIVAKREGLKVYQDCEKLISKEHAQELLKLEKKFNYNLDSLVKYDERFDIEKLLSKRSEDLIKYYAKFGGSWDAAVAAVHTGPNGIYNSKGEYTKNAQRYLNKIAQWEKGYREKYETAMKDFTKRNPGMNFKDYVAWFKYNWENNGNHKK